LRNHIWLVGWIGAFKSNFLMCDRLIMVDDRNLMAKDEFKNLGFGEDKPADEKKDDVADKGKKGELRW
jgi:hypothetical protein